MVLMTKNRKLIELARRAYERAQLTEDQILVVWNARVYLSESIIVMESACPIFLDKIVEQLRIFVGSKAAKTNELLWVKAVGNRGRRWSFARPLPSPAHRSPVPTRYAP